MKKAYKASPKTYKTTMWALTTQEFSKEFGYKTSPYMYFNRADARLNRLPYQKVMKLSVIFKEAA